MSRTRGFCYKVFPLSSSELELAGKNIVSIVSPTHYFWIRMIEVHEPQARKNTLPHNCIIYYKIQEKKKQQQQPMLLYMVSIGTIPTYATPCDSAH